MKKILIVLFAGIICCTLASTIFSCTEDTDCSATARPMMLCKVYKQDPTTGSVEKTTLNLLTVTYLGTDTIILNRQENVEDLTLPLRYTAGSTPLVFHYADASTDTVEIFHQNTPYFLSMECGYQMKQTITEVKYTRHTLDSIYIRNKEVGIYDTENLKLFY